MIGSWAGDQGRGAQLFSGQNNSLCQPNMDGIHEEKPPFVFKSGRESEVSEMSERQRMSELFIEISLSPSSPSGPSGLQQEDFIS